MYCLCLILIPGIWLVFVRGGLIAWQVDYHPLIRLVQFSLGMLCAFLLKSGRRPWFGFRAAVFLTLIFHIALLFREKVVNTYSSLGAYSGSQCLSSPVLALLVMAAANADLTGVNTRVNSRVAMAVGHWSYSWYLFHGLWIEAWVIASAHWGWSVNAIVVWAPLGVGSLTSAAAIYRFVERPAEIWLRPRWPRAAQSQEL